MAARFIRRHVKAVTATVAVAGALGATGVTAFAQDCFVVNRSVQGAIAAAHSSQWATLDVNAFMTQELGACPAQVQAADGILTADGYPLVFATRTDTTLPDNGHGIQHIDDTYIPIVMEVMSTVSC